MFDVFQTKIFGAASKLIQDEKSTANLKIKTARQSHAIKIVFRPMITLTSL